MKAPLRRVVSSTQWAGHGPLDQWQKQGFWYEYRLECGHEVAGRRIHPSPDWGPPPGTKPHQRVRCPACAKQIENEESNP